MSGDKMFYDKAIEIVDLLQGAFHTSRNRFKNQYTVIYSFKGDESCDMSHQQKVNTID